MISKKDINALKNKNILVLDIETTGFPDRKPYYATGKDEYYHPSKTKKYKDSRIVSIAWCFMVNFEREGLDNAQISHFIRKPKGFKIKNSHVHGIKNKFAKENGISLEEIMGNGLGSALENSDVVIGHNILFDLYVLASELYRNNGSYCYDLAHYYLDEDQYVDTGEIGRHICKLPMKNSATYKMPTLSELHTKLCDGKNIKFHSANGDVKAVVNILLELTKPKKNESKIKLKLLSFNVCISGKDKKYDATDEQVEYLLEENSDIMFLQECGDNLEDKMDGYACLSEKSHCGNTYLLVNKILLPKFGNVYRDMGIIASTVTTKYGTFIFSSIHLRHGGTDGDIMDRKKQLEDLVRWVNSNDYSDIPMIVAGDTNMRDKENDVISDLKLSDIPNNVYTFPNKNIKYGYMKNKLAGWRWNFRFDRFITSDNFEHNKVDVIDTGDSDHMLIKTMVKIKKKDVPYKEINFKDKENSVTKRYEKQLRFVLARNVKNLMQLRGNVI